MFCCLGLDVMRPAAWTVWDSEVRDGAFPGYQADALFPQCFTDLPTTSPNGSTASGLTL